MRKWWAPFVIVIGACSTYHEADAPDAAPGDADAGDGGSASTDGGADAGPALGPDILTNGDFELGCASWQGDNATLAESSTAHSGAHGCLVCVKDKNNPIFQIFNTATVAPKVGEQWIGEVWLQVSGTGGSPAILVDAQSHLQGGNAVDNGITTGPTLDGTWSHVTAILDIKTPKAIDLSLLVKGTLPASKPQQCFVIDDASLRLSP